MPTVECDGLIFDLDGVLVDSSALILRHWTRWAHETGIDLARILRSSSGMRTEDTIRMVAPAMDAAQEARRIEAREAADAEEVKGARGAATLLAALGDGGWAVATSGGYDVAAPRLRRAGLPFPEVLITADDVSRGKPSPEVFLSAARRLGAAPGRCLVFEDAPAGIEAGVAAGMRVVGVATTHKPDDLRGAEFIVADLRAVSVAANLGGGSGPVPGPGARFRVEIRPLPE